MATSRAKKASSTQGLPGRSPTPVLTGPSVAYLPSSNGIGSSPQSMAAGERVGGAGGRGGAHLDALHAGPACSVVSWCRRAGFLAAWFVTSLRSQEFAVRPRSFCRHTVGSSSNVAWHRKITLRECAWRPHISANIRCFADIETPSKTGLFWVAEKL